MSQAAEILNELQRRRVIIAVEGDTLCLKPRRALDETLLARIREAKAAILEALRTERASCGSPYCAECYDVGDCMRIHPPQCGEEYRMWLQRWQPKGKPQ
jgi:hypothetical protein